MGYIRLSINLRFKIKWYLIYPVFVVNMIYAHGPFIVVFSDFRVYPCTQKKSLKSLFNLIVPHHQLPAYAYAEYEAFPSERIKKHFMTTKIYTADLEYLHLCLHLFLRVRKGQLKLSGFKE